MSKLGPIHVDDSILDAIRDDRLVVFAGAGVSMGSPANLPSFSKLAEDVAAGTGVARTDKEPFDRFLGRLAHKKVKVHQLAAQRLSDSVSTPTALHLDLIRLFRKADCVRLVTTNFDLHFETAAQKIFEQSAAVFRAPALPLGRDFRGLVHVHGALTHPHEMVLTDVDFGRAYLTEGWARRFLVDVFRTYTVLFVGYSHDDAVMNYLARALPADGVAGRYALTEEDGNWKLLGITPIRFQKGSGVDEFRELYDGVRSLAERSCRGVLDWQSKLAEIGNRMPPADEETAGEVEQALREVHTTRFLVQVARLPEWPKWLNTRKQLDALFSNEPLSERDLLLAWWLAEHYAIEHADEIISLIATQSMRMNPTLWWAIGRELGLKDKKALDDNTLSRWVAVILACAPAQTDQHVLAWLAARCAKQNNIALVLEIFLFMAAHRLTIKPGIRWPGDGDKEPTLFEAQTPLRGDHYSLNETWTKHLKPNLTAIAQPLLSGIARRLEDIHHTLLAWNKARHEWDSSTAGRSAIEPHKQDQFHEPIDVLIDAARDALEWLAQHRPVLLDAWIENLGVSDVPLLRRLAIHALTLHPNKSADERLYWLIARTDLYALAEHHEIHRAVALAYPSASGAVRKAVIDVLLHHELPDAAEWSAAERSARAHFNWLVWLQKSDPACMLVKAALDPIIASYPDWQPQEHPDLTFWTSSGWSGPRSPWTVEQLLARTPADQLDDLVNFKGGNRFDGPDREGLASCVQEACKQQPTWAFQLDEALTTQTRWDSDLWSPMLRGLRDAELSLNDWQCVLGRIARPELRARHADEVANLLYCLVRDGGKPSALELLDQANAIAFDLWHSLPRDNEKGTVDNWLSTAINRPAGVVVEFWINGLSLRLHNKSRDERTLPDNYRAWFTAVSQESSIPGGLGRSLLASQVAFLFALDETWTREHIIPLFSAQDTDRFAQAWDGFLVWGQLSNPSLVDALVPAFVSAFPRLGTELTDHRHRFIEFFTALVAFHIDDPTRLLLPALFEQGSLEDRISFASQLSFFLRQMSLNTRQTLWKRWLQRYWQSRLQSVPLPLDETEVRKMLEWLPHLGELFPYGVSLAVATPVVRIEHSYLTYELRESVLVTQFPTQTAELLIYLCNCGPGYHATDIGTIAQRLPALEPALRRRLDEAMARAGCQTPVA